RMSRDAPMGSPRVGDKLLFVRGLPFRKIGSHQLLAPTIPAFSESSRIQWRPNRLCPVGRPHGRPTSQPGIMDPGRRPDYEPGTKGDPGGEWFSRGASRWPNAKRTAKIAELRTQLRRSAAPANPSRQGDPASPGSGDTSI